MAESEKPKPHPVFERMEELDQISLAPDGMERLMAIWRELLPEGQSPKRGCSPAKEIIHLEFPNLLDDYPDWDEWCRYWQPPKKQSQSRFLNFLMRLQETLRSSW